MVPVDPYSEQFQTFPFPAYARLRAEAPVHQLPGHGWYMVTTMDLVREALSQ